LIDGKESRVQYNTVFDVADMLLSSPFKGSTLHRDTRRSWYWALGMWDESCVIQTYCDHVRRKWGWVANIWYVTWL